MIDKIITLVANYITQYVSSTTVYIILLFLIWGTAVLSPFLGIAPLVVALLIANTIWLVTEYLYTKSEDDDEKR